MITYTEEYEHILKAYTKVFSGPAGKQILRDLEDKFGGTTLGSDPNESHVLSAQREVLMYIHTMKSEL